MSKSTATQPNPNAGRLHDDPDVNTLLDDLQVADKYEHNETFRHKIIKAAELLKDEPVSVLLSAIDVIIKGKVNVFFSYKMGKDKERARLIVAELRALTHGKLEITFARDFKPGEVIHETIRKGIQRAHWFILLLPDPSEDLDWCLFETGVFQGSMRSKRLNRVFCLRHFGNDDPAQIKERLSVVTNPADHSDMMKFLTCICHGENFFPGIDKLCPTVTPTQIEIAAKAINLLIFPPEKMSDRTQKLFAPFVRLTNTLPKARGEIEGLSPADIDRFLCDAKFDCKRAEDTGTNREAQKIFGLEEQPDNWGDLVSDVMKNELHQKWMDELCASIKQAALRKTIPTVQATFQAENERKTVYRSIVYGVEKSLDGAIAAFLIIFVEDVGGTATDPIDIPEKGYMELISSIRLGYRFRWEVVEPFRKLTYEDEISALQEAIRRVMTEWKSRSHTDLSDLAQFFGEKKSRVEELNEEFGKVLGDIENASEQRDTQRIQTVLTNFACVNQEYLTLSTAAFAEMNKEILKKDKLLKRM